MTKSPIIASIENSSLTENGCATYRSSLNACVDLFFQIAAVRNRPDADVIALFDAAFEENPEYALRTLFWARDIRGGQGERRVLRLILMHLASTNPSLVVNNLSIVPEVGRWDDLLCLLDTQISKNVLQFIKNQLQKDCQEVYGEGFSFNNNFASYIK